MHYAKINLYRFWWDASTEISQPPRSDQFVRREYRKGGNLKISDSNFKLSEVQSTMLKEPGFGPSPPDWRYDGGLIIPPLVPLRDFEHFTLSFPEI